LGRGGEIRKDRTTEKNGPGGHRDFLLFSIREKPKRKNLEEKRDLKESGAVGSNHMQKAVQTCGIEPIRTIEERATSHTTIEASKSINKVEP